MTTSHRAAVVRTDVYLSGDVVNRVTPAVLALSPADRQALLHDHRAKLDALGVPWEGVERLLSVAEGVQALLVGQTVALALAAVLVGLTGAPLLASDALVGALGWPHWCGGLGWLLSVGSPSVFRGLRWLLLRLARRSLVRRLEGGLPGGQGITQARAVLAHGSLESAS